MTPHLISLCFLLISLCSTLPIGLSCSSGSSLCVDDVYDWKTCAYMGWELKNFTCDELGIVTGMCCKWGNCVGATSLACALVGGNFDKNGECPCTEDHSCCFDTLCDGTLDEAECVYAGGNFVPNRNCNSGVCSVQAHLHGSCCDHYRQRCYETTQEFCNGGFSLGINCSMNGCYPPGVIGTTNVTGAGRCCHAGCNDVPDNSTCTNTANYFEEGLLCNADPCTPKGVCIESGTCVEYIPERLCQLKGGSWTGGFCDVGELGACYLRQGCNNKANSSCNAFGGLWVQGEDCPATLGACCMSKLSECTYKEMDSCSIQTHEFTPGKTCNEISCRPNGCCVSGFCAAEGIPENICLTQLADSYVFNGTCSVTGSCQDIISLENGSKSIDIEVSVNNIKINTRDIDLHFKSVSVSKTIFSLRNSNVTTESLVLDDSNMQIDFTSTLSCENELTISSSYLEVDLTSEEALVLTNENQLLMTSGSLVGEFNSTTIRIDNVTQSDYIIIYEDNEIYLVYNKTEIVEQESKFPIGVIIVIAVLCTIGATVAIFFTVPQLRSIILAKDL